MLAGNYLGSHGRKVVAALMVVVLLAVYWQGLASPFVLDDFTNFKGLENVTDSVASFLSYITNNNSGILGRPVSMLSFALTYTIAGSVDPFIFKLTNLIIHIINGWLIYQLMQPLMGFCGYGDNKKNAALCVAVFWLFTSLHGSTVLYAVQRMTQLSAMFSLMGLWLYIQGRISCIAFGKGRKRILTAYCCVILATLSKENGVLLLLLFFMLEVTVFHYRGERGKSKILIASNVAVLGGGLLFIAQLATTENIPFLDYSQRPYTMLERVLTETRILWVYVQEIVLPSGVDIGLYHDDIIVSKGFFEPLSTIVSVVAWLVVIGLMGGMLVYKKYTLSLVGICLFLAGHLLESTFINLELYFEHRNYLPSLGLWIILIDVCVKVAEKSEYRAYLYVLASFILMINVYVICVESGLWSQTYKQSKLTVLKHPDSYRAQNQWAAELIKYERYADALKVYTAIGEKHKRLNPVSQVQKIWVYCMANLAPHESVYSFDIVYMKGADALLYNSAWLYLLDEVQAGRCEHVSIPSIIRNIEGWLRKEIVKEGGGDALWDITFVWLKLNEYQYGAENSLYKAEQIFALGGVKAGIYAVSRYLSMGLIKKAESLYQTIERAISAEKKEQYHEDMVIFSQRISAGK
ncbi:hypothetical protein [Dasania marina]|uniref:hypothetical protein n=1 Tax=Dasania marina TaxID=471499 RepID=UPI0030DCE546|tara:strand:+ start:48920 stop:50824 length:1905 start_codon:yes stop_codon:yes gene_type:complete